ncbi:MAG: 2-dehydropantoate 2-reductase [Chloroflexi bacterium]|nr:2-dehydropantoate 2-reductase [Chloroflexota bacterium]MDL1942612.1 ketopantoate reductase family protein [Chloroflexi bacterium CFX2]
MKIVIFGSGGVGGYFGGRLAHAGQDVTFIARGMHLAAIQTSGLRVDSISGDFRVHPAKASDSPQSVGEADLILLAVKAWQLDAAITQMKPLVGGQTVILPLLNGIEHMDKLLAAFDRRNVVGGLCRISSFVEAPGHIRHVGVQPYIAFGELDNSKSERIESIRRMFAALDGILVDVPADIHVTMWEKFVFISGTSGVGAYTRQPIGAYREDPAARQMLIDAMNETAAVARARGVMLPESLVAETMKRIDALPYAMLASMQKDMMEGRPSELNEQTGAVIRLGRAAGIPTPTHEKLLAALLPLEQKARGKQP